MSYRPVRNISLGILVTISLLVIVGITATSEYRAEGNRLMAGPRMVFVEDITGMGESELSIQVVVTN